MLRLFSPEFEIENYHELLEKAKIFVNKRLEMQHSTIMASIEGNKYFKPNVENTDDIPYYELKSHTYKYIHSINVSKYSAILAKEEGNVCSEILQLAGILHDVSYFGCDYEQHGNVSAELAVEFLSKESDLKIEDIKSIAKIISSHYQKDWDTEYYCGSSISIEEILLLEADFLDKLSIKSGILTFIESGAQNLDIGKAALKYQKKIIKRSTDILTRPVEKRYCHYTESFLRLLRKQLELNMAVFDELKLFINEHGS